MQNNLSNSDCKVVSIGGSPNTNNIMNVPPECLLFSNGKRSWKFFKFKTSPTFVKYKTPHTVGYHGSNKKVIFRVAWRPNAKNRKIHVEEIYHLMKREPGEIGTRPFIEGLKSLGYKITLNNMSYVRLNGGSDKLARAMLDNRYNVYGGNNGFVPRYKNVNIPEFKNARELVAAIKGINKLNLETLSKLAPTLSKNQLNALMPLVGSQATNELINKLLNGKLEAKFPYNIWDIKYLPLRRTWHPNQSKQQSEQSKKRQKKN